MVIVNALRWETRCIFRLKMVSFDMSKKCSTFAHNFEVLWEN